MITRFSPLLLALVCLSAAPSHAQDDRSVRGVGIGGDVVAMVMRMTTGSGRRDTPSGVGIRVQLAYGLTERWGVFAAAQTVSVRTGDAEELSQYEAGAKITFMSPDSPVRPYVEGALVYREIVTLLAVINGQVTPIRSDGSAAQVTAGVHLFDFRNLSVDIALAFTNGGFGTSNVQGMQLQLVRGNMPSTALRVGARYYPGWLGNREQDF